ncbi:MAG: VCBS repeat-containing protein [Bryobacterales bacterium]|nr:VCBS repeat-containing protein [Bryobacterales bacterium]
MNYRWTGLFIAISLSAQTIRHTGWADLSKGTFSNSGANLYVSRQGRLQVINRWDLNNDGFNDILISNDHDNFETVDAFVYWNSPKGFTSLLPDWWRERPLAQTLFGLLDRGSPGLTRLPAFGGGRSLIADLNRDGFPELVFCNYIHNYPGLRSAYVYWGSQKGYAANQRTELPTNWAAGVAAADLNNDGYPELVFANQGAEAGLENISRDLGMDSFIYWGSAKGFDAAHPGRLPTNGASDVTIGDFNGDKRLDIAFLNAVRQNKGVQVFWGASDGYSAARTETIPLADPTALRSADLDRDGRTDIVIATSGGAQSLGLEDTRSGSRSRVVLIYGSAKGLDRQRMPSLPASQPRDVSLTDFNKDGALDIAVANSAGPTSLVYWGTASGYSGERRTVLPTLAANGVSSADLNGDGHPDLVFANSNDEATHDVPSYVYWGSATGFAPYLRADLQSFGAASVSTGDLNGDGKPEVVLINQYSGRYSGKLDSAIFWGNPHHYYSPASVTRLPTRGAYDTTVADFNDDGFADIVFCNAYIPNSYLYWGAKDGYRPDRRQLLNVGTSFASGTADLNRDGYLDLVFSSLVDKKPFGTILWGSERGFSEQRASRLPLRAKRSALTLVIADFNRDGNLDLSFSDHYFGALEIFWGSKDGYSTERTWLREIGGGGLSVADLNGDGILDFVIPGMFDAGRKSYNNQTRVYLGTREGVPEANPVAEVEGFGSIECAIADFNRDAKVDLACTNYMSDSTRHIPMFLYWGQGGGRFSDANRLKLPAESSAGIQALDLNKDGYTDLVVHNHLKDGEHSIPTYIYWNGPQGFSFDRHTELPAFGPHFSQMVPAGNQMTRAIEEHYVSAPIQLRPGQSVIDVVTSHVEPSGSRLVIETRQAASSEQLQEAKWSKAPAGSLQWLQYRVTLESADGAAWPSLTGAELKLR